MLGVSRNENSTGGTITASAQPSKTEQTKVPPSRAWNLPAIAKGALISLSFVVMANLRLAGTI